jgi:hypothetical protein
MQTFQLILITKFPRARFCRIVALQCKLQQISISLRDADYGFQAQDIKCNVRRLHMFELLEIWQQMQKAPISFGVRVTKYNCQL